MKISFLLFVFFIHWVENVLSRGNCGIKKGIKLNIYDFETFGQAKSAQSRWR